MAHSPIMSKKVTQYKSDVVFENEKEWHKRTVIKCVKNCLTTLKMCPEKFILSEFANTASLIHELASKPGTYPPPASVDLSTASDVLALSKGIGKSLYDGLLVMQRATQSMLSGFKRLRILLVTFLRVFCPIDMLIPLKQEMLAYSSLISLPFNLKIASLDFLSPISSLYLSTSLV